MSVGRREGIRPADIVGSIANEANVPGREIGPIDIREDITYVGVPERYVEVVVGKLAKKRFRGRALNLRVAPKVAPQEKFKPRGKSHNDFTPRRERATSSKKPPRGRGRTFGSR
jgi:ATP-dependent RNA helicase DeaD